MTISRGGSVTTADNIDAPIATITLDGKFRGRPKITLTPVGENLGNVNVWANSITHIGNGIWQAEIESSEPNILVYYNVMSDQRI